MRTKSRVRLIISMSTVVRIVFVRFGSAHSFIGLQTRLIPARTVVLPQFDLQAVMVEREVLQLVVMLHGDAIPGRDAGGDRGYIWDGRRWWLGVGI